MNRKKGLRLVLSLLLLVLLVGSFTACDYNSTVDEVEEDIEEDNQYEERIPEHEFLLLLEETNEADIFINDSEGIKIVTYPDKTEEEVKQKYTDKGYNINSVSSNIMFQNQKEIDLSEVNVEIEDDKYNWHHEYIYAPEVHNYFYEEMQEGQPHSDIRIAVVDGGVSKTNPYIKDKVNRNLSKNFTQSDDGDYYGDSGHGTHVAGIIANSGHITGIMDSAEIIDIKVLEDSGYGTTDNIIKGIQHAVEIDADVINLSLGGDLSDDPEMREVLDRVLRNAAQQGTIPVAAAGNENSNAEYVYPAGSNYTISVAASEYFDDKAAELSGYSNYGKVLDTSAPGTHVKSLHKNENYVYMSGTSMASPHIAAMSGILTALDDTLSYQEQKELLRSASHKEFFASEYERFEIGYGHANLYSLLCRYFIEHY